MPETREALGGAETNIHCQATTCRTRVLAEPQTVKWGVIKVANQEKALKHSENIVFVTNLKQMFKITATDLNTKPPTTQHRLRCALKTARLLPDVCCRLDDTAKKFLFR